MAECCSLMMEKLGLESQAVKGDDATIKITDIESKCLERIFRHLNLKDLFSVAMANKNFTDAAVQAFKRKFGKKEMKIDPYRIWISKHTRFMDTESEIARIETLSQLSFIRLFGKYLSKLRVVCHPGAEDIVHDYIDRYCRRQVREVELCIYHRWNEGPVIKDHLSLAAAKKVIQREPQIKHLAIQHTGNWNDGAKVFNAIQPHLEKLSIAFYRNACSHISPLEWKPLHFPNMKRFSLNINNAVPDKSKDLGHAPPFTFAKLEVMELVGENFFTNKWFDFIAANKNLTRLNLYTEVDERLFRALWSCITTLPKLETLAVHKSFIHFKRLNDFLLAFGHLKQLRIYSDPVFGRPVPQATDNQIDKIKKQWDYYHDGYDAAFIRHSN